MPVLADYDIPDLEAQFRAQGHRPGHALRLLRAFYQSNGVIDLEQTRIGKALIERIGPEARLGSRVVRRSAAADGTVKLLLEMESGGAVEAVLMPAYRPDRAAGCLSSQVGCAMGCDFCASTKNGFTRNLTAGEMVEQFLHLRREAEGGRAIASEMWHGHLARVAPRSGAPNGGLGGASPPADAKSDRPAEGGEGSGAHGRRLSTIVFMGMGEPLLNLDNVIAAIRRLTTRPLTNFGRRAITVSTVGIVPGIDALAEADLNIHLAVSLHAPDDETRARIIPTARRYKVAEIMAAAQRFQQRSGRVVNIEYTLLAGVNDSPPQAEALAELMRGFNAHVNLIPYNPIGPGVSGRVYERPSREAVLAFLDVLMHRGVVAHIRRPRGDDVAAACGQLAAAPPDARP